MRVEIEEALSEDEEYGTTCERRSSERYNQSNDIIHPTRDSSLNMDSLVDDAGYTIDSNELPVDRAQQSEEE